MEQLLDRIIAGFEAADIEKRKDGQVFFTVPKPKVLPLINHLKMFEGFRNLILMTAVDWIEDNQFQITYLLNNPDTKTDLGIRTFIGRDGEGMDSIHELWGHAATFQREMKEMFGIGFPGSPRVDEPFLLEGWDDIPPMRREFDTKKYSEETYFPRPGRETHDPATYMKQKLYPND
ncbi:MAG: NADH-quinone oxidoreductase subunit C [Bacteroidales bacterium]|nr:NADH-quinone oxidoreductase subunit C [Bacteroidales bacterium]